MRRPTDWQAPREYLTHEKRAPRMAAFDWLNPGGGAGTGHRGMAGLTGEMRRGTPHMGSARRELGSEVY